MSEKKTVSEKQEVRLAAPRTHQLTAWCAPGATRMHCWIRYQQQCTQAYASDIVIQYNI